MKFKIFSMVAIFLISFGFLGASFPHLVLNASGMNQGIDYNQVYIEASNMTQEEYGDFVVQVNEQYGIDFETELGIEGIDKEQSVSSGAMIATLYKSWKACGQVARGMGMPGCGTVISTGYRVIKSVFQEIYG